MYQDFPGALSDGCFASGYGHREDSRPRYRLEELAAGLGRMTPDFDSVWSIRRLRTTATAAFADGVARVVADEVDALAMLHSVRSYWGFHPRPMPFDMRLEAIQS